MEGWVGLSGWLSISNRPTAPPSGSIKCLTFDHWLTFTYLLSVLTRLQCGDTLLSVLAKEFSKSISIWLSYEFGFLFISPNFSSLTLTPLNLSDIHQSNNLFVESVLHVKLATDEKNAFVETAVHSDKACNKSTALLSSNEIAQHQTRVGIKLTT